MPVHGASGSEAALAATYVVELRLFMMLVDLKLLLLLYSGTVPVHDASGSKAALAATFIYSGAAPVHGASGSEAALAAI